MTVPLLKTINYKYSAQICNKRFLFSNVLATKLGERGIAERLCATFANSRKDARQASVMTICRGLGRMASQLSLVKPLCLSAKWQRTNSVVPFPTKMLHILAGSPLLAPTFWFF